MTINAICKKNHLLESSIAILKMCNFVFVSPVIMYLVSIFSAKVAFRIRGLYPSSSTDIRFQHIFVNLGDGYSSTTGIFTCSVPGLYWFSAALSKNAGVKVVGGRINCSLKYNGKREIDMYTAFVDDDKEGFPITISVLLNLARGDRVQIGGCDSGSIFHDSVSSYFSGVLVRPDNCLWGLVRRCIWKCSYIQHFYLK